MEEKEVINKVISWFGEQNSNYRFKTQRNYKISFPIKELNKPYFRVDLIVIDPDAKRKVGVECKSIRDSDTFRKLCAGFGQAYVLQRVFGCSFLAIEVNEDMLPDRDPFKFYKRISLLPNINKECGIGVLLVGNSVYCVDEPYRVNLLADDLFIPMRKNNKDVGGH